MLHFVNVKRHQKAAYHFSFICPSLPVSSRVTHFSFRNLASKHDPMAWFQSRSLPCNLCSGAATSTTAADHNRVYAAQWTRCRHLHLRHYSRPDLFDMRRFVNTPFCSTFVANFHLTRPGQHPSYHPTSSDPPSPRTITPHVRLDHHRVFIGTCSASHHPFSFTLIVP